MVILGGGHARGGLADLRLRQGRLQETEELPAGLEHHGDAVLTLVLLHPAMGQWAVVTELVDRYLSVGAGPTTSRRPCWRPPSGRPFATLATAAEDVTAWYRALVLEIARLDLASDDQPPAEVIVDWSAA